jgi:histone H3
MARTKAIPIKLDAEGKPIATTLPSTGDITKPPKRKHHWRPGTVALREIRQYQKSVNHVVPRSKMVRLIRDIAKEGGRAIRFKGSALDALHEAAETEMVRMFKRAMLVTINGAGTTLQLKDLKTANAVASIQ